MKQEMNLEQAKSIIDNVLSQCKVTREEHIILQTALDVLVNAAKVNESEKDSKATKKNK